MKGTIVNALAIAGCGLLGASAARGILLRYQEEVNKAIKLGVAVVGIQMALKGENLLITFGSLIAGIIIGQILDLNQRCIDLGECLSALVNKMGLQSSDSKSCNFQEGFVTCSLVYCVGAMAIIGSIQDGLTGNTDVLYLKAVMDGVTAVAFATTWGIGVAFSAFSVLVYQGLITVLAQQVSVFFTPHVINELTAVGGISILAISLKLLGLVDAKIADWIPSIFVAMFLASIF